MYEITFITTDEKQKESGLEILKKAKAEIVYEHEMGRKNFAYPIKKEIAGFYWNLYFEMDKSKLSEVSSKFEKSSDILRHLIILNPSSLEDLKQRYEKIEAEKEEKQNKDKKEETKKEEKEEKKPAKKEMNKTKEEKKIKKEEKEEKKETKTKKKVIKKKVVKKSAPKKEKVEDEAARMKKLDEKLDELLKD